eukprot:scaffold2679_cov251-Pinguiococcus_pyrenoidosus.AAC.7
MEGRMEGRMEGNGCSFVMLADLEDSALQRAELCTFSTSSTQIESDRKTEHKTTKRRSTDATKPEAYTSGIAVRALSRATGSSTLRHPVPVQDLKLRAHHGLPTEHALRVPVVTQRHNLAALSLPAGAAGDVEIVIHALRLIENDHERDFVQMDPADHVMPRYNYPCTGLEVRASQPCLHPGLAFVTVFRRCHLQVVIAPDQRADAGLGAVGAGAEAHLFMQRHRVGAGLAQSPHRVLHAGARRKHQEAAFSLESFAFRDVTHFLEQVVQLRLLALLASVIHHKQKVLQRVRHHHQSTRATPPHALPLVRRLLLRSQDRKVVHVHLQQRGQRASQRPADGGRRADDLKVSLCFQGDAPVRQRLQHDGGRLVMPMKLPIAAAELLHGGLDPGHHAFLAERRVLGGRLEQPIHFVHHEDLQIVQEDLELRLAHPLQRPEGLRARGEHQRRLQLSKAGVHEVSAAHQKRRGGRCVLRVDAQQPQSFSRDLDHQLASGRHHQKLGRRAKEVHFR